MKTVYILIILIFLVSCTTYNKESPDIIFAKQECENDNYTCFLNVALEMNNPSICLLLNAAVDDMCMQDYYTIKNNSAVCKDITKQGVKENCIQYYEKQVKTPEEIVAEQEYQPSNVIVNEPQKNFTIEEI